MKIKMYIPALLAAGLICLCNVQHANAYFTTYVMAEGGYKVSYKHETTIEEQYENWNKYVTITNKEGSIPVYVRVKAFAGSKYSLEYAGENWKYQPEDGYYYYTEPVNGGEKTKALRIFIDNIPVNPESGENFNVIVIYETIPAQYNADNEPVAPEEADWSKTLSMVSDVISGSQEENGTKGGGEENE